MLPKSFKILLSVFGVLFLIGALILRPVPIVAEEDAIVESGIVYRVYEGGEKDLVIMFQDDHRRFYINRGLENGLDLAEMQEKLVGNKVTVKYPKYWTPLDWNNDIRHISKLEMRQHVFFNELKS